MISAISLATIGSIELLLLIESASVDELIVLIGASFAEYIFSRQWSFVVLFWDGRRACLPGLSWE